MRKKSFIMAALASFIAFSSLPSFAAKPIDVLVIDSGSDFTHKELKPMANPNLAELKGTEKVDDDNNGYVDDVYGWNFVENNSTIVNLTETPPEYDKVLEVMKNINKMQQSGKEAFTKEEWNAFVDLYNNPKLKPWVNFCGGWAHGTHCAGIIASNNKNVAFKAIRHIPTGKAPSRAEEDNFKKVSFKVAQRTKRAAPTMDEIAQYFDEVGKENADKMKTKADYIAKFNPRLINCSFGTPNQSVLQMMRLYSMQWGMGSLSDAEIQKLANLYVTKTMFPRDKVLFGGCKNALVFIAAGNSAEDLDICTTSPQGVPMQNKIVVAATNDNQKIADFSCWGKTKVDLAVPGVNIYATYPNQKMGYMSGTSMACPNALGMASLVLTENPDLTPVQLKKILMETVDKKDWLKDKVKSGGVINVERAVYAAKQIKAGKSIAEAIKDAKEKVGDMAIKRGRKVGCDLKDPVVKKIYFSNVY